MWEVMTATLERLKQFATGSEEERGQLRSVNEAFTVGANSNLKFQILRQYYPRALSSKISLSRYREIPRPALHYRPAVYLAE